MLTHRRITPKSKGKAKAAEQRSAEGLMRNMTLKLEELIVSTRDNPTPVQMDVPRMHLRHKRVFSVKQNALLGNITTSSTLPTYGAFNFTLNSTTNVSNFAAIFDSWRIEQVTVRFIPTVLPVGGAVNPPLLTVIDYDDSNVPVAISDLREYDTLYESRFGTYQERTFHPKYAVGTYSGAFTSFSQGDDWCDVASPGIQWFGIKYAISSSSASSIAWSVEADIIYNFQSVR